MRWGAKHSSQFWSPVEGGEEGEEAEEGEEEEEKEKREEEEGEEGEEKRKRRREEEKRKGGRWKHNDDRVPVQRKVLIPALEESLRSQGP